MSAPHAALPEPSLALRASQLAAFLVPGVALTVPSGYSAGAVCIDFWPPMVVAALGPPGGVVGRYAGRHGCAVELEL